MKLRDLIGVLGHELRTPLAAILGYQELLSDGLYGGLSDRQREPVERIHQSAQQLLHLLDGLQELAESGSIAHDEIVSGNTREISRAIISRLQAFAQSRSVQMTGDDETGAALGAFRLQRFMRAAEIAVTAAIKASHGSTLRLQCTRENGSAICALHGCLLDPARDHPARFDLSANGPPPTATQLRLAMAEATLSAAGGSLRVIPSEGGSTLELVLPVEVNHG